MIPIFPYFSVWFLTTSLFTSLFWFPGISMKFLNLLALLMFTAQFFFLSYCYELLRIAQWQQQIPISLLQQSCTASFFSNTVLHFWKCERAVMLWFVTTITLLSCTTFWVCASIILSKLSWHRFWSNCWRTLISYNAPFTSLNLVTLSIKERGHQSGIFISRSKPWSL